MSRKLLIVAVALLLMGAIILFAPVLMMDMEIHQDAEAYNELRTLVQPISINEETTLPPTSVTRVLSSMPAAVPMPVTNGTSVDLSACKAQNEDFIAWLQIPDTPVDYPVVWTDDTNYYLNHTFSGKKSYLGTLFSLCKTDYCTPSKNISIYGHHIRSNDSVMFSPLLAYKDASFYEEHETIALDSLYCSDTYTIFAVINMRNGEWEPSTAAFGSDEDFLRFVHAAKAQALYETGVEVSASDYILTLITCDRSYGGSNGRLLVMAVKNDAK